MAKTLIAENLSKSFGSLKALSNFSLTLNEGDIIGMVGPNGAGKTTAMRILSTIMQPDNIASNKSKILINDIDALKDYRNVRKYIGYISQNFGLYLDLSVEENINFYSNIYDIPKQEIASRTEMLLSATGMSQFKNRLVQNLSGGMKQKVALACALVHKPNILILDEPTNGVDPVSRREFWHILRRFSKEGTSILYSTSYMEEAERCDTIILMNEGSTIVSGSLSHLQKHAGISIISVAGNHTRKIFNNVRHALANLSVLLFGSEIHIHIPSERINELEEIKRKLEEVTSKEYSIKEVPPTLEDIFIHLTYDEVANAK